MHYQHNTKTNASALHAEQVLVIIISQGYMCRVGDKPVYQAIVDTDVPEENPPISPQMTSLPKKSELQ